MRDIDAHLEKMFDRLLGETPDDKSPVEALPFMQSKLKDFFGDL
ncbi:MAG TPA: hypothetical protein VJ961_10265 [Mariprofundaceae bacterium]|nr:hypothetical protein [Mariprofundaceae bacterium]